MKLLGASAALATAACQQPQEQILPYVRRPEEIRPGIPLYYATSFVLDGFAMGLVAESHEGRPTKLEGNPEHPASLGATSAFEQATILDLYDPARVSAVSRRGAPVSWEQLLNEFRATPKPDKPPPWFVLYPQSSPLLGALVARIRERHRGARFSFVSPLAPRSTYAAARALFDRPLQPQYDFKRARVVLALDADFLTAMPMSTRWARDFAERRRLSRPNGEMNRFYAVEPMPTSSSSLADHRLALRARDVPRFAAALLGEVLASPAAQGGPSRAIAAALGGGLPRAAGSPHAAFLRALASDLVAAGRDALVIAGESQPPETHVIAHALNAALGSVGNTVHWTEPTLLEPEGGAPLTELVSAIQAQQLDTLVILEANPVHTAPAELDLGRWLTRVPNTIHLTHLENATSQRCQTVLPAAHFLESWGDARAYDGTLSFIQPLIEPRVPARSAIEILAAFAGHPAERGHTLLREHWRGELGSDFDARWEELVKRGFAPDTHFSSVTTEARWDEAKTLVARAAAAPASAGIELRLEPSPCLYDGRFANNPWLLELPHPVTKQCWGNAALLAPATAKKLGVTSGDVLDLEAGGRKLRIPALVCEGHAERSITIELGYGEAGRPDTGANGYALMTAAGRLIADVRVQRTNDHEALAITQEHWKVERRPIAVATTLAEYRKNPEFTAALRGPLPTLLRTMPKIGTQWAMTIDTTICTGCSACVVACQAENNVPVVGKAGVLRSREMHWLRIDRYSVRDGGGRNHVVNQPMLCQHCENAPCEYVCPVNATVHSPDGLNEMVYNRCIGTRFCSNNCPYKVRRFNWFDYTEAKTPQALQRNPEVTVRERGVMEKCTFCVQRIRRAEIAARVEQRAIRPGEVTTACQQACATGAIQFGALEHAGTPMVEWRKEPRRYAVLYDVGTRPRVQYLAAVKNPNPAVPS